MKKENCLPLGFPGGCDRGQSDPAGVEVLLAEIADILDKRPDFEEIVGVLIAVAPAVGVARTVSAAPELALVIGYDINGALTGTKK